MKEYRETRRKGNNSLEEIFGIEIEENDARMTDEEVREDAEDYFYLDPDPMEEGDRAILVKFPDSQGLEEYTEKAFMASIRSLRRSLTKKV